MKQTCKLSGEEFEVGAKEIALLEKISPTFKGKRFNLPLPTLSADLRLQRRLAFRNERSLYQRKSDLSGKSMICMYSSDKPYKVYEQDEWWGSTWDGLVYGRDFDFNRPFFEQFKELELVVPHNALYTTGAENSHYTNFTLHTKNCYLLFGAGNSEDCLYSNFITGSKDCLDCISLYNCELCYNGIASQSCYHCLFFNNCRQCTDCIAVEDCTSCSNCILCFGLYQKEFYVMNKYVGKEIYLKYKKDLENLSEKNIAFLYQELEKLKENLPHRASHIYSSEDCTGDMIFNSKNCTHSFDINESEDSSYIFAMPKSQFCLDACFGSPAGSRFSYEICSALVGNSVSVFNSWYSDSVFYSREVHHSRDLFGCVGLKNKQFCIFNKQYSEKEYQALAAKITEHMIGTGEWGEYFPIELSPFGYNETIANDHFPLEKEEALALAWNWKDDDEVPASQKTNFPEFISEVDESICNQTLYCEETGKAFKIIPKELKFYKTLGLPIPTLAPNQRYRKLFSKKAPRRLFKRNCAETGKEIWTTYSPNRKEKVVSEEVFIKNQR